MAFRLEYRESAARQLRKLDRPIARAILDYMDEVADLDDPRSKGKGLSGELVGLWRYRVGDFRIICRIVDSEVLIVALEIVHRANPYC
ncbi:MAG: type II toxin-antitoxin system RelE/ParE family toxin [Salinibacterium sp.]|nr:MAG: type II toxin-antitoxin system RelE/ParE family toxin [Salinibacterium sp.]